MLGFGLALSAGFCAAMASLCVKLALSPEEIFKPVLLEPSMWREIDLYSSQFIYLLRTFLFILTFAFNALMWTLFVKSLRTSPSSAQAMVTNNGSNFMFSALFGKVIFGEVLSFQWWCGASFIVLGLFLINKNIRRTEDTIKVKEISNVTKKEL